MKKIRKIIYSLSYKYNYYIVILAIVISSIRHDSYSLIGSIGLALVLIGIELRSANTSNSMIAALDVLKEVMYNLVPKNGDCKIYESINECDLYKDNNYSCDGCPHNQQKIQK